MGSHDRLKVIGLGRESSAFAAFGVLEQAKAPLGPGVHISDRPLSPPASMLRNLVTASRKQAWGKGGGMEGVWRDSDVGRATH